PVQHVRLQQRRDERDRHPGRRDQVAADGGAGAGQAAHPVDEQRERDDVAGVDEVGTLEEDGGEPHSSPSSAFGGSLRLNMPSIRSVTKKPPMMLIVPYVIAITNSPCSREPCAPCLSTSPPNSTIPWLALVPDIS